jgi:type 1 fimbriae regulatory protein FimB
VGHIALELRPLRSPVVTRFRHGLRVSELCSIKLCDINLETREFHVNRLKDCNGGPHEQYNGESPAVRAWLAERAKMNPPESCDVLFISERRKPLSRVTVWLLINQIAQAAGLEHLEIHPHMLRHSCGRSSRKFRVMAIEGELRFKGKPILQSA